MIQVFLGYRDVMEHVIARRPRPDGGGWHEVEEFADEVQEWCDTNMSGPCWPIYVHFEREDPNEPGRMRTYGRYEFCFQNDRDATLFRLFWVGADQN